MLNRLLHSLLTLLGILIVAARRLRAGRALALVAAFGLTLIVAFTMGIPLYADAVYHRVLGTEIARGAGWRRPPFAFLFRYVGKPSEPRTWEQIIPLDDYLDSAASLFEQWEARLANPAQHALDERAHVLSQIAEYRREHDV